MSDMIEAYRIGVEMALMDKVTPELMKLTKRLGVINKDMGKVLKSTQLVNKEFATWMETAKQLNASLRAMSDRFARMARVADEAGLGLKNTAAEANAVAASMERAAAAAKTYGTQTTLASRAARYSLMPGSAGGGRGGGGTPPVVPMPSGRGRGHGRWGHIHAGPHGFGISSAAVSLGDVMPWVLGGAIAYSGAHAAFESATQYQNEEIQLKANGLTPAQLASVKAQVSHLGVQGVSQIDAMKLYSHAFTVMNDVEHAQAILPLMARMKFANDALYHGKFDDRQYQNLLRVAELRGGFKDYHRMTEQLNLAEKAITGMGGNLNMSQYLGAIKTGGAMLKNQTDQSFFYALAPLMQEKGGSRVGTMLNAIYMNWVEGRMTAAPAAYLDRLGLVVHDKTHGLDSKGKLLPHSLLRSDLLETNIAEWIRTVWIPTLARHGMTTTKQLSDAAFAATGRQTAGTGVMDISTQLMKILKDIDLHNKSADANKAYALTANSNAGVSREAVAAWADFKTTIGQMVAPVMVGGISNASKSLRDFTRVLQGLSDWMAHNSFKLSTFNQNTNLTTMPGHGFLTNGWNWLKNHLGGSHPASPKVPHAFHVDRSKTGDVYLDGHKVGKVLEHIMGHSNTGPLLGGTGFDASMHHMPTAATGGF